MSSPFNRFLTLTLAFEASVPDATPALAREVVSGKSEAPRAMGFRYRVESKTARSKGV
jgi:hypothetical protein